MARSPLRGRSDEMSCVLPTLRRIARGGHGAIVLVTGEAGIGKTALLDTIGEQAKRMGFGVGVGKAEEVDQIAPGAPLLIALRSGPTPLLDGASFGGLAALYGQTLWFVDQIADLLEGLAKAAPIVVAIDDMQWADRLTRFAVRLLPSRLAGSPVVWVLASREPHEDLLAELDSATKDGVTLQHIAVGPLRDDDLDSIAKDLLGSRPTGVARARLHGIGGNPLLAVQLLEGMARARSAGQDVDDLPSSLVTGIRARLRSLPRGTVDLLRIAAVWGRPFTAADATGLLDGTTVESVLASVDDGVHLGLLTDLGDAAAFRHDLVRESVYVDIPAPIRVELHRRCARYVLASGQGALAAAPHARASAKPGDEEAVSILRQAAADSGISLPEATAELIRDAFDLLPRGHKLRLEVGEECADVLSQVQRGREAVALVDSLLADPVDAETEARLQVVAARALWFMGLLSDIDERVDTTLSREGVPDELRVRLRAAGTLALTRTDTADVASAAAEAVLGEARRVGDQPAELLALQALGEVAKNEARHENAYRYFHALRESAGSAYLAQEITELQYLDRYDEAQALLASADREVRTSLDAVLPSLVGARLWQDFNLGRYDEAEADARTAIRLGDELGTYVHKFDAWQLLSMIAIFRGDLPLAREMLRPAERADEADEAVRVPGLKLIQGYILASEGRFAESVGVLRPLMASASTSRNYWPRAQEWMRFHAGIARAAGDEQFAADTADRAEQAAARNPGVASFEGIALQVRGFVTRDTALLGDAVELLRRSPRPVLLAGALADHGAALLATPERELGVARLDEACETYARLGHRQGIESAQRHLQTAGLKRRWTSRPANRPELGRDALTATERTVAELVSRGRTNRAAATELGVSSNTVGTHLRSIFTKLDVRSRVQLANAWHQHAGEAVQENV